MERIPFAIDKVDEGRGGEKRRGKRGGTSGALRSIENKIPMRCNCSEALSIRQLKDKEVKIKRDRWARRLSDTEGGGGRRTGHT